MDLYQTFLEDKGKWVKTHVTENVIEINNAMAKEIPINPKVAKSLEISNLFEDFDSHDKASD